MTCVGYQILDAESARVCRVHCPGCAEAASLRDRVDELRTELESHVNADAAWKIQVNDLRTRLAAAESQALTNGEARDVAEAAAQAENTLLREACSALATFESQAEGTPGEGKGRL